MAKPVRPFTKRQVAVANVAIKVMSRLNTWLYRGTRGTLGAKWMYGAPIMLLTTVGRKSGRRYTTPLLYMRDADNVVCVASKGGMDHHPLWYKNLQANPDVDVQIGTAVRRMRARTATEAEKAAHWPRLVAMYPDFDDYQARTKRDIPVVILSTRGASVNPPQ